MGINTFSFDQHQHIGKRVLTLPRTPGTARGGHSQGTGAARHPSARRFCKGTAPCGQNPRDGNKHWFGGSARRSGITPTCTAAPCPLGPGWEGTARQHPGCHPARSTAPGCLAKARCKRTKDEVSVACVCPETSVLVLNLLLPFFFVFFPHQSIFYALHMAINVFINNRVNISQIKGTAHVQKQDS